MKWAAQQGLILAVEVRWLNEIGLHCPDARVPSEDALSDQYVVMLALAAKGQLSCADVEWNSANGLLTWRGAINLAGVAGGCQLSVYAKMVTLLESQTLTCDDIEWNRTQQLISDTHAAWLRSPILCSPPAGLTGPPAPPSPLLGPGPGPGPNAYYSNCAEARAAGVAPLHQGQPGYRSDLDSDGDGIACEVR
jgi:hypothetical protein